jgi:hypothetical protein
MSYNEEKRCACLADVKRRIFFSRRSKGWCEFSARLFNPLCCRCSTPGRISRFAARISLQLIGHDHTWNIVQSFHELTEKLLGSFFSASALRPAYPARSPLDPPLATDSVSHHES